MLLLKERRLVITVPVSAGSANGATRQAVAPQQPRSNRNPSQKEIHLRTSLGPICCVRKSGKNLAKTFFFFSRATHFFLNFNLLYLNNDIR